MRPFLLFALALVACASCLDPTQITVKIDTSYDCTTYRTDAALWIGNDTGSMGPLDKYTATKSCTAGTPSGSVVGSIVVVPSGTSGPVWVRVLAGINGTDPHVCSLPQDPDAGMPSNVQCIEAKRLLRFVPHSKLEVEITLDSACINVHCPKTTESCQNGMCVGIDEMDGGTNPMDDAGDDAGRVFKPASNLFGNFDDVCAMAPNGPYCWGSNTSSQLAMTGPIAAGPTHIPLPSTITQIGIGAGHMCATDGATVWCWGSAAGYPLGRPTASNDPTPTPVSGFANNMTIAKLVTGAQFNCIQTKSPGSPTCWGTVLAQKVVYAQMTTLISDLDSLTAGARHVCGVSATKTSECWGDNAQAQLDLPMSVPWSATPETAGSNTYTSTIVAGFDHTVVDNDNRVQAACSVFPCNVGWGSNAAHELGGTMNPVFPQAALGTSAQQLVLGENHFCFVDMTGLHCRGSNGDGQLGGNVNGGTGISTVPLPTPKKIVAGRTFTCALVADHVWCWGTIPGVMTKQMTPAEVFLP